MTRNRMHLRIAAAGFAAILLAPAPARAGLIYSFDTIAENGTSAFIGSGASSDVGTIIDITAGGPSINDAGTVSFRALTNSISGIGGGIFTGDGGSFVTSIADSLNPSFPSFVGTTSINTGGTVAFLANLAVGGGGIFTGTGGPTATVATNSGSFAGFGSPAINDGGTVAFQATLDAGGGSGVYARTGGSTTNIASSSGPLANFGDPAINNGGTVAFRASLDAGGSGVFTGAGGATTTIATASYSPGSGPFAFILGDPSINNGGTVAFASLLNTSGGGGIFTGNGGPTTTLVDFSGPFSDLRTPAINDGGTVAFLGVLDAGGTGIFTGPDPALDKVIAIGDPLGGSTVTGFHELRGDSINNVGQIAFSALLADGTQGIFRATPGTGPGPVVAVPEPSALALFAMGLVGLAFMGRRRRRSRMSTGHPRA